ncbi:MAG: DUF4296 domain-containing protein [Bacteroidales bacterium]|nr:DUF4296 domain-containing protein [Bacteroidales bacterium]
MKRFLHIVLVLLVAVACRGPRVIPKDTLTDIYTDMFLADQVVREENIPRTQMDTMLLYEAVFRKYGYDTDDYLNSVRYYLKDPERFAKVFESVAKRLEGEIDALDKIVQHQQWVANQLGAKRPQLDSILAPFSKESVYVGLARVARDTSRYPAWFRLVAVQEDTLMVPVDSVDARAAKDSLQAEAPADTTGMPEKLLPEPEKPPVAVPGKRGRERRPRVQQKEMLATEKVAVEEVVAE